MEGRLSICNWCTPTRKASDGPGVDRRTLTHCIDMGLLRIRHCSELVLFRQCGHTYTREFGFCHVSISYILCDCVASIKHIDCLLASFATGEVDVGSADNKRKRACRFSFLLHISAAGSPFWGVE